MKHKKLIALILAVVMCLGVLPMAVSAAAETHTVTFDVDTYSPGDLVSSWPGPITVTNGDKWNLTKPMWFTAAGTEIGWYTKDFEPINNGDVINLDSDITVYACTVDYATQRRAELDANSDPDKIASTASPWAQAEVAEAFKAGLIPENRLIFKAGSFDYRVSRVNFCELMAKVIEVKTGMDIVSYAESKGKTVGNHFIDSYSYVAIEAAYSLGIATGISENRFEGGYNITREDAVDMLKRTANVLGISYSDSIMNLPESSNPDAYGKVTSEQAIVAALRLSKAPNGQNNDQNVVEELTPPTPTPTPTPPAPPAPTTTSFTDVPATAYYADAVKWAIDKGITNGTSANTFSPETTCNTAQILTFLWRAYGCAEPSVQKTVNRVSASDYFYKAVLWAMEKGIFTDSNFDANIPCTRAMTVTYLWRAKGSPTATKGAQFTDVGANSTLTKAVAWAVEAGVTTGTSSTKFSPDTTCTRGQIVTFLYRALASNMPKESEGLPVVDFSTEYMSSTYYKAMQEVVLTGDYRKDMLAVAYSQIGYCEGDGENQLDGSYRGSKDYTEYGRYFGSNGSAWCSEFASWCARVAKVPTSILNSSDTANTEKFGAPYYTWSQTVYAGGTYTPRPGDIALFAWYGTSATAKNLSHTAIVYDVETNGNNVKITLIEGNGSNSVKMSSISVGASTGEMKKGYLVYFVAPEYES